MLTPTDAHRKAWVREKKKTRQAPADPTENLRGALHYFSCTPNYHSSSTNREKVLQHQLQLYKSLEELPKSTKQRRVTAPAHTNHNPSVHHRGEADERRGPERPRPYREEFPGEEEYDEIEVYEPIDHRPRHRPPRYQYERDVPAEPPRAVRARPSSPALRPRTSRQHVPASAPRTVSSRWASATASLPSLS